MRTGEAQINLLICGILSEPLFIDINTLHSDSVSRGRKSCFPAYLIRYNALISHIRDKVTIFRLQSPGFPDIAQISRLLSYNGWFPAYAISTMYLGNKALVYCIRDKYTTSVSQDPCFPYPQ